MGQIATVVRSKHAKMPERNAGKPVSAVPEARAQQLQPCLLAVQEADQVARITFLDQAVKPETMYAWLRTCPVAHRPKDGHR